MKKVTMMLVICLFMCFFISFPAFAATDVYMPEVSSLLKEAVQKSLAGCPSGYPYVVLSTQYNPSGTTTLNAVYFSSSNVSGGSTTYYERGYLISSSGTITATSSLTKGTGAVYWEDYNGSKSLRISNKHYFIDYFLKDRSTAKLYNTDTYRPTEAWHLLFDPPPPNITALQTLLTTAKAKPSTGYTTSSWKSLQAAITAADNLLKTSGYTQTQVDDAKNNLQAALDGLTLLPDTTALQALLSTAKAELNTGYTTGSWQALQDAITAADALLSTNEYIKSQVDTAKNNLQAALDGLTLLPDITALQSLLTTAKAEKDTGYTASSWKALQGAITAVDNLLKTTGYTQTHVDDAKNNLQIALDNLTVSDSLIKSDDIEIVMIAAKDNIAVTISVAIVLFAIVLGISFAPVIVKRYKKG